MCPLLGEFAPPSLPARRRLVVTGFCLGQAALCADDLTSHIFGGAANLLVGPQQHLGEY